MKCHLSGVGKRKGKKDGEMLRKFYLAKFPEPCKPSIDNMSCFLFHLPGNQMLTETSYVPEYIPM